MLYLFDPFWQYIDFSVSTKNQRHLYCIWFYHFAPTFWNGSFSMVYCISILLPIMTYHRMLNKNNRTGVTSRTETNNPSGTPDSPRFLVGICCSIFRFLWSVFVDHSFCLLIFSHLVIVLSVLRFTAFNDHWSIFIFFYRK